MDEQVPSLTQAQLRGLGYGELRALQAKMTKIINESPDADKVRQAKAVLARADQARLQRSSVGLRIKPPGISF